MDGVFSHRSTITEIMGGGEKFHLVVIWHYYLLYCNYGTGVVRFTFVEQLWFCGGSGWWCSCGTNVH